MSATQNQQEPHFGGVENLLLVKMPAMKYPINPLTLRPTVSCNVPYLSVAINTRILSLSPLSIPSQNPIQIIHRRRTPYKKRQSTSTTNKRIPPTDDHPIEEERSAPTSPFQPQPQPQTPPGTGKGKGNCVMTAPDGAYILNFPMYP